MKKISEERTKKELLRCLDADGFIRDLGTRNPALYSRFRGQVRREALAETAANGDAAEHSFASLLAARIEEITGYPYDPNQNHLREEKNIQLFMGLINHLDYDGVIRVERGDLFHKDLTNSSRNSSFPTGFKKNDYVEAITGLSYDSGMRFRDEEGFIGYVDKLAQENGGCIDILREARSDITNFWNYAYRNDMSQYAYAKSHGWYFSKGYMDIDAVAYAKYKLHQPEFPDFETNGNWFKDCTGLRERDRSLYNLVSSIKRSFPEYANGTISDMLLKWGCWDPPKQLNQDGPIIHTDEHVDELIEKSVKKYGRLSVTRDDELGTGLATLSRRECKSNKEVAEKKGVITDNLYDMDPEKYRLTSMEYNNTEELMELESIKETDLYKYFCKETKDLYARNRNWIKENGYSDKTGTLI
ncbi:MAG: hypothetical protein LBN07_01810 [Christensenellaceae bacterium]|jgi:hypothetical protein|nr:hypothetical protein [Christensenellaceae bacterium]